MGLDVRKPVFGVGDQQRRRPACASTLTESIMISKLATGEISIFQLVSVAKETGLCHALSETLKTGFVVMRPIYEF